MADATIVRYEPCPDCADGSCGKCGPESGEHAAPGVRLVVRRIRFVRCSDCNPYTRVACPNCGPNTHPLTTPGIRIETVEEYAAKRWVPAIHLRDGNGPRCKTKGVEAKRLTKVPMEVTCGRCLKR